MGDLERLQDIQNKRDTSNRNWQRIILYNIAKELHEDSASEKHPSTNKNTTTNNHNKRSAESLNDSSSTHDDDDDDSKDTEEGVVKTHGHSESPFPKDLNRKFVFETRQLWFKLHEKMQQSEYGNMLLLVRMKKELEHRMYHRRQRFLTFAGYEELVNKLHLDSAGHVVEPFVALSERPPPHSDNHDNQQQQQLYYVENMAEEQIIMTRDDGDDDDDKVMTTR